jgi:hypothetical protein
MKGFLFRLKCRLAMWRARREWAQSVDRLARLTKAAEEAAAAMKKLGR